MATITIVHKSSVLKANLEGKDVYSESSPLFPQNRFIVRDFEYDSKAIQTEREERQKLEVQLKRQFVSVETRLAQYIQDSEVYTRSQ